MGCKRSRRCLEGVEEMVYRQGRWVGCDSLLKVLHTSKEELDMDRTNSDNTDGSEYKMIEPVILPGAKSSGNQTLMSKLEHYSQKRWTT